MRVRQFVQDYFCLAWADESMPASTAKSESQYLSIRKGEIGGLGAFEYSCWASFGPRDVAECEQCIDIGRGLLVACLWGMRAMGYAYGGMSGVCPTQFYARAAEATILSDSAPGINANPLRT